MWCYWRWWCKIGIVLNNFHKSCYLTQRNSISEWIYKTQYSSKKAFFANKQSSNRIFIVIFVYEKYFEYLKNFSHVLWHRFEFNHPKFRASIHVFNTKFQWMSEKMMTKPKLRFYKCSVRKLRFGFFNSTIFDPMWFWADLRQFFSAKCKYICNIFSCCGLWFFSWLFPSQSHRKFVEFLSISWYWQEILDRITHEAQRTDCLPILFCLFFYFPIKLGSRAKLTNSFG